VGYVNYVIYMYYVDYVLYLNISGYEYMVILLYDNASVF